MADAPMSGMSEIAIGDIDGNRLLAEGADGAVITTTVLAAYAVDQLHGATVITSLADTDEAVVFQSDAEKIITVLNLAAYVIDSAFDDTISGAVTSTSSGDLLLLERSGVQKRITIDNLIGEIDPIAITVLDIDGGSAIGEALADADLIIVDNGGGGTNVKCAMTDIYNYIEDKIQAQTPKTTPVGTDILMIQDAGASWALKKLEIEDLWDNLYLAEMKAVTEVKTATWVKDENDLASDSDTHVPTQQSVKYYVDNVTGFTVAAATPLTVAPAIGDYMVISDEDNSNVNRKVYVYELFTAAGNLTDLGAIPATDDRILITDEDEGSQSARSTSVAELLGAIGTVTALGAAPATNDRMICTDTDASAVAKAITVEELFEAYFEDMTPGTGISSATQAICEHRVSRVGGLYKTEILIDLTDLADDDAAGDIIGKPDDTANCHIGQITAALNGTIIAGRVTCFETPAGGDPDIDLWYANEATGAQGALITGLTGEIQCINHGDWTAEDLDYLTALPAADKYLYLAAGASTNNTYTAGILLIELWGK